uniref:Methionine aminopeptidase n=1 Tax=Zea mays TaxID=4577 RepID=A0A804NM97_MAIZE
CRPCTALIPCRQQQRWRRGYRRPISTSTSPRRSSHGAATAQVKPPSRRLSAYASNPERRGDARNPRPRGSSAEAQPGSGGGRRREPLRRGAVSARLPVPDHIRRPPYVGTAAVPEVCPDRQVHDGESIMRMLDACELAARVLHHAGAMVKPSVTTDEIDRAVHQMIVDAGAYPSPLGYGGFPKSVCTSVNECTCHGIPDSRELQDGDIINIDVTVYLNGYHGDTSRTYLCGEVDDATKQLVKVTEECMMRGISACRHGASFKEIGQRISEHAEKYGYGIDPFVGHGVGRMFHCEPIIWHTYDYEPGFMVAGQTFTVEPTLSMGSTQCVVWDDGWTAVAADGSLSAQFEHTVLVTGDGAEVLTGFP